MKTNNQLQASTSIYNFFEYKFINLKHSMGKFSRLQIGSIFPFFFLFFFFFFFFEKIGFDNNSCKLSPNRTICMKCQILFSNKNNLKKLSAEVFTRPVKH